MLQKISEIVKTELKNNFSSHQHNSIYGDYSMRFDLGGNLTNGSKERVEQAKTRAFEIFKQSITANEVLLVIEEYENEFYDPKGKFNKYLYELLDFQKLKKYKGPFLQVYFEKVNDNEKFENTLNEPYYCDLHIGKFNLEEINTEKIIEGIVNLEMGFEPCIPQDVTFYAPASTVGFRVYDDRGCDVWSKNKENLKPIYINLNDWILDCNRDEIDKMFK